MKKNALKYSLCILAIPAFILLVSTCKSDNSLQSSLSTYDPILELARYISFNHASSSRAKGVYTLSLSGTQVFDSDFWGWEKGTPQSISSLSNETAATNDIPEHYLSNGNKTVNSIHTFNDNEPSGPQYFQKHTASPAFANGTFPSAGASTGIIRPLQFETIRRAYFNTSGEQTYDADLRSYSLTYDDSTGLIQSYSILRQNNTTDTVTLNTYGFSEDPRSNSSYYASSYTKKTGTANTLVGSVTTTIEVDSTASNPTETHTHMRFDQFGNLGSFNALGDLGYLDGSFFDNANSSVIVKIVKTITTYYTDSGTIAANSVVTVTEKYSNNTNIVFKEETINRYESSALFKLADYQYATYNVSGSTETKISQSKKFYTDGYLVLDQAFSSGTGWTSPSSYITYTRDNQGRITSKKRYNSAGELTIKEDYTFDSSGRTATIRAYSVDSSSVETCYSVNNKDYSYSTISTGKQISETSYGCNGANHSSSPSSRVVWSYNSLGKLTLYQFYSYTSNQFLLISQTAYGYGSSGEKQYTQSYTVDGSGEATATNKIEYTYDENLFRTSTINKNASDQVTSSYYVYTYTYK